MAQDQSHQFQIDAGLVIQSYKEVTSSHVEQIVLQAARIKMLEMSNLELGKALEQSVEALKAVQPVTP